MKNKIVSAHASWVTEWSLSGRPNFVSRSSVGVLSWDFHSGAWLSVTTRLLIGLLFISLWTGSSPVVVDSLACCVVPRYCFLYANRYWCFACRGALIDVVCGGFLADPKSNGLEGKTSVPVPGWGRRGWRIGFAKNVFGALGFFRGGAHEMMRVGVGRSFSVCLLLFKAEGNGSRVRGLMRLALCCMGPTCLIVIDLRFRRY